MITKIIILLFSPLIIYNYWLYIRANSTKKLILFIAVGYITTLFILIIYNFYRLKIIYEHNMKNKDRYHDLVQKELKYYITKYIIKQSELNRDNFELAPFFISNFVKPKFIPFKI